MKKTTSSLFAATAALGLIAASAGVAFTAEAPTTERPHPSPPPIRVALARPPTPLTPPA